MNGTFLQELQFDAPVDSKALALERVLAGLRCLRDAIGFFDLLNIFTGLGGQMNLLGRSFAFHSISLFGGV